MTTESLRSLLYNYTRGGNIMDFIVRKMTKEDVERVIEIFIQGISTKKATFQTEAPSNVEWDQSHMKEGRLVAVDSNNSVLGWVALSPTSSRCVYRGVAEISIYIAKEARTNGIGLCLMNAMIKESEKMGLWTLQSGIFEINEASIALHKKCGFRIVGIREKIAQDSDLVWQNTVLMERRSKVVGLSNKKY